MRILLIDDDVELCKLLSRFLLSEGIETAYTHDGDSGLEQVYCGDFDLAVLDVMMPGKRGMDVLREIRQRSKLPVIMLTARGEEMDRIIGLELGADDYVPKPCNPRELAARIRAVLRRAENVSNTAKPKVIHAGSVEWHPQSHTILDRGKHIELTTTEYSILAILMQHIGEVVSKQALSEEALGKRLGSFDRSLDMHIGHIRKKLSHLSDGAPRIKTIRGVGWLFVPD